MERIETNGVVWDFIIIGGGATGLGVAVDAASRGFKTVLLEQSDFAKATSGRSTKLVHGGVRYLQSGDIMLVREALRERGRLLHNAPHLVKKQRFIIPCYSWWEKFYYSVGLTLYDWLSGKLTVGRSRAVSKSNVIKTVPQIIQNGLCGGVAYYDGQFDDSRLAINLMQTANEQGAIVVNYARVSALIKNNGKISGVAVNDETTGKSFELKGTCIVNATGVFVDEIIRMDDPNKSPMIRPSQGIHLLVDRSFLDGDDAILIPKTSDGRVLFAVPWRNRVVLGTTDTPVKNFDIEPRPLEEEIDFVLKTSATYLTRPPRRKDVLCAFAGLRPLAAPKQNKEEKKTKEISRNHKLISSNSGLITITGGKWTTYRQMAQETVDLGIKLHRMPKKKCQTANLKIHGYKPDTKHGNRLHMYGSDADKILELQNQKPEYAEKLHHAFDFTVAEIIWAVRKEMAITVEDVLARRVRALYLDARCSIETAPKVAKIMAQELLKDEEWERKQIKDYTELANGYIINSK